MSTPPSTVPWNIVAERLGKIFDFGKNAIDLTAKLAVLMLVLPGLLLWTYLDRIGWQLLFLDSISSTSGLLALLIGTVLLVSGVLLVLCAPSIFLLSLLAIDKELRVITKSTAVAILLTVVTWMAIVFAGSLWFKHLSVPVVLLITFAIGIVITLVGQYFERTLTGQGKLKILLKAAGLSLLVTIAAVSSGGGFLTVESFAGDTSTNAKALSALATLLPLTLAGFLPGLMAISLAARSKPATVTIKYVTIGVGFVLYILVTWSLTSLSTGIGDRALEKTGVYSTTPQDFELLKDDARDSVARVGIPITSAGKPTIRAYVRYAFGDVRLLCASEFRPGITDGLEDPLSNDPDELKRARNMALDAGRNCVVLRKDDIRPIRFKQSH
jgi:hypothetical protein